MGEGRNSRKDKYAHKKEREKGGGKGKNGRERGKGHRLVDEMVL